MFRFSNSPIFFKVSRLISISAKLNPLQSASVKIVSQTSLKATVGIIPLGYNPLGGVIKQIAAMKLVSLSAHFDGQSIQLDEPYKLESNTKLIVTIIPEQLSEREAWFYLSSHQMNNAYTQEDEYPLDAIKIANPDYAGS